MQSRKRLTEANIWESAWFMDLSLQKKLFWIYLNNRCDNIGVWSPNLRLLSFHLEIDNDDINGFVQEFFDEVNSEEEKIIILKSGSWLLIDFVRFQYCKRKSLNPNSQAHRSYLELMKYQNLLDWFCENKPEVMPEAELSEFMKRSQKMVADQTSHRPLTEVFERNKDKDTDKDKDKDTDKDKDKSEEGDLDDGMSIYASSNSIPFSNGRIKEKEKDDIELSNISYYNLANELLSIYPKQSFEIFFDEQIKCEDALESLVEQGYTLNDAVSYIEEKIIEIRENGGSLVGFLDGIKFKKK